MSPKTKKTATFLIRWGIAVAGVWYVLAKTSFHDRVLVIDPRTDRPVAVRVLGNAHDSDAQFDIIDPVTGQKRLIDRDQVWIKPDGTTFRMPGPDGTLQKATLLAVRPSDHPGDNVLPAELLILDHGVPKQIDPSRTTGVYTATVPYPRVDIGLIRLVHEANPWYLLLALAVLPVGYFVTSFRWHMLLEVLEIPIGLGRTFIINMVGAFYNTFMPGSTGGDLVKAYYASKHTTHRVRAVISVIWDRLLGLLALIVLGGAMAALQLNVPDCRRVAIACGALLVATAAGLFVFYHPLLRKITGFDFILARLPAQRQLNNAVEAMHLYGRRPIVSVLAIIMTFPVHITTIVSASLAGHAFGISMPLFYYWVAVPVIVLVGAIPISPQGAGVMEFFAIELTRAQGVPTSQALALAMSIRLGAMFWNLVAGLFVLRGGYHAPTAAEQNELEKDEAETPRAIHPSLATAQP